MTTNDARAWQLTLHSLDPVSVGSGRSRGFHTPTQPYLPGGTIRGALAALWLASNGDPASDPDRFRREVGALSVGPGLAETAVQVPLSYLVCKYRPKEQCPGWSHPIGAAGSAEVTCAECGGRSEPSKGQWMNVDIERMTRVSLTDDETAADQGLFSRDALESGQTFRATALGDLAWLPESVRVQVGGRRTVGGRMEVEARLADAESSQHSASGTSGSQSVDTVDVRALSPVVLLDPYGRNVLEPSPADLAVCLGLADPSEVELVRAFNRPETVGGWNAAARLPKSTEVAACQGSVFRVHLRTSRPFDALIAASERNGLGIRRQDGYGWVTVRGWQGDARTGSLQKSNDAAGSLDLAARIADEGGAAFAGQCLGWLRERKQVDDLRQRAAYTGLTPDSRALVGQVLRLSQVSGDDPDRRRLILALELEADRSDGSRR